MKVKKFKDLLEPIIIMAKDAHRAEEQLTKQDDTFTRRNYIRAVFAMIEGSVYMIKQTILSASISNPRKISIAEYALLKEETFDLDDRGNPKSQIRFIRLANNVRFTARCLNKIFGCKIDFYDSPSAWDEFLKAIKIRNRITHPKGLEDFQVSAEEAELIKRVCEWYNDFIMAAINGIEENLIRKQKCDNGTEPNDPPPKDVSRDA